MSVSEHNIVTHNIVTLSTYHNPQTMKKQRLIEIAAKVIVAALTAFLTALTTTSCMGRGPLAF